MPRRRDPQSPLTANYQIPTRKFGPIGLTRNQVRVLLAMRNAGRGINACEIPGVNLQSFYRLREFGLVKSKMMAGAKFQPRFGLLWWLTAKGNEYLDALIEEYGREQTSASDRPAQQEPAPASGPHRDPRGAVALREGSGSDQAGDDGAD